MEEWRDVPGFPLYRVSSHGRVRSEMRGRVRPLRTFFSHGYERVTLVCLTTKARRKLFVHRLVAQAFHGDPDDVSLVVAHLDGDSTNNRAENLRWTTHEENCAHKSLHGTLLQGEQIASAKLTPAQVGQIRLESMRGERQRSLSERYGVDQRTISRIVRYEIWKWVGTWEEFQDPYLGGPPLPPEYEEESRQPAKEAVYPTVSPSADSP